MENIENLGYYSYNHKIVDPDYLKIKQRGINGEIGKHPDFNFKKFTKNQHKMIEEILREMPISLQAKEVETGKRKRNAR